jgi:exosortase
LIHPTSSAPNSAVVRGNQSDGLPGSKAELLWDNLGSLNYHLLALAAGVGVLCWAYWPNLEDLYATWSTEPNYSHGKLVVPIAIAILWQRLSESKSDWKTTSAPWWGWILLVSVLAARAFAYEQNTQWLETATLIPAVATLVFTLGGWPLLQRAWPAIIFLLFMLPLPRIANNLISLPLQHVATLGSVFVMQLTGLRASHEGNVIHLPDNPINARTLEVALACNGLSMLMTLAATVTATIMLIPLANWKRIVVLLSAIPIALISNIIRIAATGWCYSIIRSGHAKEIAHDYSGYLMMPLSLILVGLEILILSWLAGPGQQPGSNQDQMVFAVIPQAVGGKSNTKTMANDL